MTAILVPLDGSPAAERALPSALTLALALSTRLILFRSVSGPSDIQEVGSEEESQQPLERPETEASNYLNRLAERVRKTHVNVCQVVRRGEAAASILDYAEEIDAFCIVLATHGHSGLKRWLHGSVAERVLQASAVPVLLVHANNGQAVEPFQPQKCERILLPLDGSRTAEQVLPTLILIARALESRVVLFRSLIVNHTGLASGEWYTGMESLFEIEIDNAEAYLACVASRLSDEGIEVASTVTIGSAAEAIVDCATVSQVDLIAMCDHGRSGLERWALGGVVDRVLRASGIPVLVVRAKRKEKV